MRSADVVDQHQVACLPRLTHGVGLVNRIDLFHDLRAEWLAGAEPGVERQTLGTVNIDQVFADLGGDRPLVQERDLVEETALTGDRVMDYGIAALTGAQSTVGLPLELDRIGATVGFHGAPVVGPERLRNGRTDLVVVAARQQPAFALEPLGQILGQGLQHGRANQTRRSRRRWWGR